MADPRGCPWPPLPTVLLRGGRGSPVVELLGWTVTQLVVVAVIGAFVGLGPVGWLAGAAYAGGLGWLLFGGLRRARTLAVGPANRVTLARAMLVGGVLALVADRLGEPAAAELVVPLSVVAIVLDGVDGRVARRTGTASDLGARFDNEADAFLVLVLSVNVATVVGPWVLAIGAMRYLYVAASVWLPWLRGALPPSQARRVIGLAQGLGLVVASSGLLPRGALVGMVVVLLGFLCWSFGRDVVWLLPRSGSAVGAPSSCPPPSSVEVALIRVARTPDLPVLREIEVAAGRVFRDVGMAEIAGDEALPLEELARFQEAGRAWVAVDADDRPVAYLIALEVDGALHVEQVSVHPEHARRGIGRSLLEHAAEVAAAAGLAAVTLTTFVEVPWNAPYYERCGFSVMADEEVTPGLRAIRRREAELGLDRWPRVCMRRPVPA